MKRLITICALFLCVCVSTVANATILGTVDIEGHSNGLSSQAVLYSPSLGGENGGNFYTGIYSWTNNGGTGLGVSVPDWGFCIELPQSAYNGPVDVMPLGETPLPAQYGTPMGITKANEISELWGKYFQSSWLTSAGNPDAQAFSFCIWEIVYGTGTNNVLTDLGFYVVPSPTADTANSWLASLNGTGPFATNLVAISTANGQDYVVQVPEPLTLSLLGLGGLLLRRRK